MPTAVAASLPALGDSEKQSYAASVLLCLACLTEHNVSNADWRCLTRLKTVPLITHCMCVLIHEWDTGRVHFLIVNNVAMDMGV